MPQELRNYVKKITFAVPQEIDGATDGAIVDTYLDNSQGFHFDTAMVMVATGEFGVDVGSVKFEVYEADASNMSGATLVGDTTIAAESLAVIQVERKKRYLRVKATPVASGSPSGAPGEDVALVFAGGLLTNWAVPMPIH